MKIIKFNYHGEPMIGVMVDNYIVPLPRYSLAQIISLDQNELKNLLAQTTITIELTQINYEIPVDPTSKIICVGLNYHDHALEVKKQVPDYPIFFVRYASSLVGHNESLTKPSISDKMDYEGELAVIIGRKTKNVSEQEAIDAIFGYSIFNDVTMRDYQGKSTQWLVGKNFDQSGSFGPYIITKDAIKNHDNLQITTKLNGIVMQHDSTHNMIFSISKLISTLSQVMTLEAGDVIVTGTPSGVGYTKSPPVYLKLDDVIEVSINQVGTLINRVNK